jgi:hypothetical protein
VWSGASGGDTGANWENAYSTLMKDWGAEAGFTPGTDFVYVRSSHSETSGTTVTVTGTTAEGTLDPVRILCVTGNDTGTDPGTLTTGATVQTSATSAHIEINEKLYIYGVKFQPDGDLELGQTGTDSWLVLEQCTAQLDTTSSQLYLGTATSTVSNNIICLDTDINFQTTSGSIYLYMANLHWDGGSSTNSTLQFTNLGFSRLARATFRNMDLSSIAGDLVANVGSAPAPLIVSFERCLINAGATLVNGTIDIPGAEISFHHCQSGTDADPAYQMKRYTYQGTVETDTARYRDNGASDGERTNPYSWSLDTAAGSNVIELYEPLESPPIAGWTDGDASTAHTYRVYVASGATLQDDEVWVELIGPNDAATDSLGVRKTTRPDPLATPANLTTDASSTWNGADVTTKQQIDVVYTPDKPGPITARVYVAKPSERVSIDPKIYIDP